MISLITHAGTECAAFFRDYFLPDKKILFIGTLGFNDACLHFPRLLASTPNVDFLFLIESRPEVASILAQVAERNKQLLEAILNGKSLQYRDVQIVADDTANVAGRNATKACSPFLNAGYTDIVVDATGMSRGVCFPIARQAFAATASSERHQTHVVVAGKSKSALKAYPETSDAPQYMHGFQSDMDTDSVTNALKLWVPQLGEGGAPSLDRIFQHLKPDEVSPILPFPSSDPRRGDNLLSEFQEQILGDWNVNLMDVIYAHESDPTDVYETIKRIHQGRTEAFGSSTTLPTKTILSPFGSRVGSVGMLFAAIEMDLPVIYSETMGYACDSTTVPEVSECPPNFVWHVWLRPSRPR